jgi:hypothetical protein
VQRAAAHGLILFPNTNSFKSLLTLHHFVSSPELPHILDRFLTAVEPLACWSSTAASDRAPSRPRLHFLREALKAPQNPGMDT